MTYSYSTNAVHGNFKEREAFGAVIQPVYNSTTYIQPELGKTQKYEYGRGSNPTRLALEQFLANLEGAETVYAFSSGMAATTAALSLFKTGDKVLFNNNMYGGTFRYISRVFPNQGISYEIIDDFNTFNFDTVGDDVKAVFIETPSNPLLYVSDLKKASAAAHKKGLLVIVDNTFMTSFFQKPLELGADIVVCSTTKYYGGHSDIIGGFTATNSPDIANRLKVLQNTLGAVPSPDDCFLLQRSIKTMPLRLQRQTYNTEQIIKFLSSQKAIEKLFYPTLIPEQRSIQEAQSSGSGAVFSLILKDTYNPSVFVASLKLFDLAVSLGAVESLVCHPATMTHESFTSELRLRAGITDNLIRFSVGIEDADDLISDLSAALKEAGK
ncbi:MAG: bifunctional cystathionine gamma-lyase/homocysteine desulfhydrase [Termitinemataceae bacterium]|nr:MAG: bifunctional cystathionine gamma-lyase/homocysteine desulfhydrase [Termitinemataceae bacterium]